MTTPKKKPRRCQACWLLLPASAFTEDPKRCDLCLEVNPKVREASAERQAAR